MTLESLAYMGTGPGAKGTCKKQRKSLCCRSLNPRQRGHEYGLSSHRSTREGLGIRQTPRSNASSTLGVEPWLVTPPLRVLAFLSTVWEQEHYLPLGHPNG